jgi:hypothetical protein
MVFIRGQGGPIQQYSVSTRTAYYAVGGLIALVTCACGMGFAIGLNGADRVQAYRLVKENQVLSATLDQLRGEVQGLEGTLQALTDRDQQIRVLAGLNAIEEDVLEVGVGGPGLKTPESHPLYSLDASLGETAFAVTYDLKALERRAQLLGESFTEATDSLSLHAELLASTPSILPTPGLLSSRFSTSRFHPIHHRSLPHEGVDISAPRGSAILSTAKGSRGRSRQLRRLRTDGGDRSRLRTHHPVRPRLQALGAQGSGGRARRSDRAGGKHRDRHRAAPPL